VVVGVPAAGQASSGLTGLVGHCVNLLPIRLAVDPEQPLSALLKHSSTQLLDGFEHQALTYAALLRHLQVSRDPRRLPLVSVMFNLDQPLRGLEQAYPNLQAELSSNPRHFENFELFVNAVPVGDRLRLECQYNTDLFDEVSVRRWLAAFETLLQAAVGSAEMPLGELAWLNEQAQTELKALQPPPVAVPGDQLMHAGFAQQCRKTPDSVAVLDGTVSLSYQALDRRANRLARAMRARGVRRGSRVGLCLTRQAEMVVALLATLRAGRHMSRWTPVSRRSACPSMPKMRRWICWFWTRGGAECADRLARRCPRAPAVAGPSRDLGGSERRSAGARRRRSPSGGCCLPDLHVRIDGQAQGVAVPHRAVANFLHSMVREPGLVAGDCLAAVTTLSFDIAVLEWLLPLQVGARALIVPREVVMDAFLLNRWLEQHAVTAMQGTPSLWRMLLDTPGAEDMASRPWWGRGVPAGRGAATAGAGGRGVEPLWPDGDHHLVHRLACGRCGVEASGHVDRPPAGQHRGVGAGPRQQPCPVGVSGEIYIGGHGVAIGYVNRPELTQERFLTDGLPMGLAGPLYRTGDRGRWCNDGLLEHQGRLDFQVKVRGYRIELGEIESACEEVSGVAQCVVLAREDSPGDTRLVAYLTLRPGATLDESALKAHLRGKLPDYMLPQHVVSLPRMPLLPNGKVDRKALPAPERGRAGGGRAGAGAQRHRALHPGRHGRGAEAARPGRSARLLRAGGHSLLAARLTAQINRHFEINLPLSALFEAPDAERLAHIVEGLQKTGQSARRPITVLPGRRTAPLTPTQEWVRFVQDLNPERLLYNTPSAHRLRGPMDLVAFEKALKQIIHRQPALRSRILRDPGFAADHRPALDFELPLVDLSSELEAAREQVLMQRMQEVVDTPIDIHRAPLFRAILYRMARTSTCCCSCRTTSSGMGGPLICSTARWRRSTPPTSLGAKIRCRPWLSPMATTRIGTSSGSTAPRRRSS
jgi:non-ribosomal peptide synthetase component F